MITQFLLVGKSVRPSETKRESKRQRERERKRDTGRGRKSLAYPDLSLVTKLRMARE